MDKTETKMHTTLTRQQTEKLADHIRCNWRGWSKGQMASPYQMAISIHRGLECSCDWFLVDRLKAKFKGDDWSSR